jgi:hypothetical protein
MGHARRGGAAGEEGSKLPSRRTTTVSKEPYFPVLSGPRPESYRAPAAQAPAVEPPRPARVVVTRPDPVVESSPAAPPGPRDDALAIARARAIGMAARQPTYWERHRLFVRYPRAFGAALTVLSGYLTYSALDTLENGGWYSRRVATTPAVLLFGLWALAFGFPLNDEGKPPMWWSTGAIVATLVGFGFGLALLSALES